MAASIPSSIAAVRAIVGKISPRELVRCGAARNDAHARLLLAQAFDAAKHLERLTAPPFQASE
jgi:hypothetical protein